MRVMDATTTDPRELMQELLPAARRRYIRAWEWLADGSLPLDKRRAGRDQARSIADDHLVIAAALSERQRQLAGDDLLNARHLATELERHAAALQRLADLSPHGVATTGDLRPESLGCGRRYRDPSKAGTSATRVASRRRDG